MGLGPLNKKRIPVFEAEMGVFCEWISHYFHSLLSSLASFLSPLSLSFVLVNHAVNHRDPTCFSDNHLVFQPPRPTAQLLFFPPAFRAFVALLEASCSSGKHWYLALWWILRYSQIFTVTCLSLQGVFSILIDMFMLINCTYTYKTSTEDLMVCGY